MIVTCFYTISGVGKQILNLYLTTKHVLKNLGGEIARFPTLVVGRAVESEVPSSDSDSGPTPTFSCISYLK